MKARQGGGCCCRKYEWIVKGGEEVRIDQRIQQLFDVMNGLMQRQPGAAAHSLQVRPHSQCHIRPLFKPYLALLSPSVHMEASILQNHPSMCLPTLYRPQHPSARTCEVYIYDTTINDIIISSYTIYEQYIYYNSILLCIIRYKRRSLLLTEDLTAGAAV